MTATTSYYKTEIQGKMSSANKNTIKVAQFDISKAYTENGVFIGRVIRGLTGEGPHVDDLLQETFILAFKNYSKFQGKSSFKTWLYSIASNQCKMYKRSLFRFKLFKEKFSKEKAECDPLTTYNSIERKETAAAVHKIIQKIPFKQREVFILYELEEQSGNDIAVLLDIPVGTVWTRLHYARKIFKSLMRKEMEMLK